MMRPIIHLLLLIAAMKIALFSQTAPKYLGKRSSDPSNCVRVTDYYYNTTDSAFKICTARGTPGTWSQVGGSAAGNNYAMRFTASKVHHVNHGMFWLPTYPYTDFFWDMLVRPTSANTLGYVISAGYGGNHNLLLGFNSNATTASVTGNIWDGSQVVSFTSDAAVKLGDWVHIAVGWDGEVITVWVNGVPEGQTTYVADTRSTPLGIDGALFVGGSDHNMFGFDLKWIRGFEGRSPFPAFMYSTFPPERYPRAFYFDGSSTLKASFLADYSIPGEFVPDLSDGLHTGTRQVETNTVVAAGGITGDGDARSIITASGLRGSPVTVTVPVTTALTTASQIAALFRSSLKANAAVKDLFKVGGSGADITLSPWQPQANDATLNFTIEDVTSAGITEDVTSADTTAGYAGFYVRHPGARGVGQDTGAPWLVNMSAEADLPQWVTASVTKPTYTPDAVPGGSLIFDSFGRHSNRFWDTTTTAGSTEGGSRGVLAWQGAASSYGTSYGRLYPSSLNAQPIYVSAGTDDTDASLVCENGCTYYARYTDANNHVIVQTDPANNYTYIGKVVGGVSTQFYYSNAVASANPLRVVVKGSTVTVSLGGVEAFSGGAALPTGNNIGLQVNGLSKVDKITVNAAP